MQPDCVCKARFFSKNVPISAKKFSRFQAIFTVFHRLSEDFQQRFPQFVERQNILKNIPWEDYAEIQSSFKKLDDLTE